MEGEAVPSQTILQHPSRAGFLRRALTALSAIILFAGAARGAGTQLRVTSARVNLRCKPGLGGEVVYVASRGELLTAVKDTNGEWVEVVAPRGASLYVYAELVRNGVVAVPTLQARSRDGIDHQTVCVLKRGDKVTGRGKVGDWLKIAPPRGCTLWIAGKYVEPPEAPKKKPPPVVKKAPPKPPTPPPPPRPPMLPPPPPKPPLPEEDTGRVTKMWKDPIHTVAPVRVEKPRGVLFDSGELVGSEEQGLAATHTGTLRKAGPVFRRPSAYCLIDRDSRRRAVTQCYVLGSARQLAALVGGRMRIEGAEYWLQGVRHPVLVPKRIYRKK